MTIKRFFESEEAYQQYLQEEEKLKKELESSDEISFLQIIKDLFKSCIPASLK